MWAGKPYLANLLKYIMISLTKILLLVVTLSYTLLTASSQERCISEHFLENENSVFTCDFQGTNKDVDKVDDESKCVHLLGLPDINVCGEMGLRFKVYSDDVNSTMSLSYYSDKNREIIYETIENGNYGWNHWSKTICADFKYGVNLYVQELMNIQLDRFLLFVRPQDMNNTLRPGSTSTTLLNFCRNKVMKHKPIYDPDVQYFGWKVTAIILIIVTVGSLILVISLSVTMPYNVWDKPKIQRLPVRLTDGIITSNE